MFNLHPVQSSYLKNKAWEMGWLAQAPHIQLVGTMRSTTMAVNFLTQCKTLFPMLASVQFLLLCFVI